MTKFTKKNYLERFLNFLLKKIFASLGPTYFFYILKDKKIIRFDVL